MPTSSSGSNRASSPARSDLAPESSEPRNACRELAKVDWLWTLINLVEANRLPHKLLPAGEPLGQGCDGQVYRTKTADLVLKLTLDADEAWAALALRKLALLLPGIVRYHRVLRIRQPNQDAVFALWRDEIEMPGQYGQTLHQAAAMNRIRQVFGELEEDFEEERSERAVNKVEEIVAREFEGSRLQVPMNALVQLARQGVLLGDVHPGNIGDRGGVLTIFDVGRARLLSSWNWLYDAGTLDTVNVSDFPVPSVGLEPPLFAPSPMPPLPALSTPDSQQERRDCRRPPVTPTGGRFYFAP